MRENRCTNVNITVSKNLKSRILSKLPSFAINFLNKLLHSEINRKIATGAFWSLSGTIISKGLLLLSSIIVARILGAEVYGQAGIIRSTVNMFTAFAGMGIGITATKYIAELKGSNTTKVLKIVRLSNRITILTGLILAIFIILFAQQIGYQINAPHLKQDIQLGALILFFNTLNGVQLGILAGFEDFKSIAKNNLWSGAISFFAQIIFAYIWGLTGTIIGIGTNFFALWILNKYSVDKHIKPFGYLPKGETILSEISILWKFSLPAVLSGIMVGPVIWVCNVFLVNQPNGYAQMALFDAANQWRITILFIPGALSQIILPMLSSSAKNMTQHKIIFLKNIKLNTLISVLFFILIVLIYPIITKMYGAGFEKLYLPLITLAFSTVFISINNVIGQYFASKEKLWTGFLFNIIWGTILILISFLTIHIYNLGALGLAISFCLAYFLHFIFQYTYLRIIKYI
jgi:O-antigen/teichoic acid export membrane protein